MVVGAAAVKETASTAEDIPFKDTVEISIALRDIDKSFPQGANDPLYQQVQKDLNIKIVPKALSWSDWNDKLNVWAASGQLPDVFCTDNIGKQTYFNWINQGIVKELPADLNKYPNVKQVIELPDVAAYKVNGKNYFIC